MQQAAANVVPLEDAVKALRKRHILDAAREVFERQGLEGASIRSIAIAAGCTTGAIYPHFRGKEEIFALVLSDSLNALGEAVSEAIRRSRSPDRALRNATLAIYKFYEEQPLDLALALNLFNGVRPTALGGGLDEVPVQKLQTVLGLLAAPIGEISRKSFAPMVAVEATAIFAYLVGLLTLRHSGRMDALNKNAAVLLVHYTSNLVKRLKS